MMDISFSRPMVIGALVLVLGLFFMAWLRRGHRIALPVDHTEARSSSFLFFFTNLAEMLPGCLLAVAIFILAGPMIKGEPVEEKVMKNILFCLDSSGSMTARFGDKTRYDGAMEAIQQFTEYREGDSFGLTVFGTEYLNWIPVTEDTSCLNYSTPFLSPTKMPRWFGGGTMMGKGLRGCLDVLKKAPDGDKMIIVVSDGASSDDVVGPANELKSAGIVVHCVFIGSGGAPGQLYTLANTTGGKVFTSADKSSLKQVFKSIDKMEDVRFRKSTPRDEDYFKPFCYAGLSVLGLYLLTLFGLRYTPW